VRAFAAGKHVYCEKPLALSVKDCDIMCESAKKSGKVFMVGQQMRYHNHIHRVVDYIKDGKIGKPVMAWLREFRNPFPSTMQWIFDKSKSGGMLMDKSCHHFDLFNWFLNSEPVSVFASGAPDVFPDAYSTGKILEDNAFVTIDYANGARAMLHLCMFTGRPHYSAEVSVGTRSREFGVIGSEGMLRAEGFDLGKNIELRFNHSGNVIRETVETFGNEPGRFNQTGNVGILMDFAECIRTGKKPFAAGDIGRMSVAVAVAGEISMAEKRIVKIDEVL
jgi:predicted dehydrogenase